MQGQRGSSRPYDPGFAHLAFEVDNIDAVLTRIAEFGWRAQGTPQPIAGGTKVAWGGPPLELNPGRDRQRFGLVADDVDAAVERLVGLGAGVSTSSTDGLIELTDPDGHEFTLARA